MKNERKCFSPGCWLSAQLAARDTVLYNAALRASGVRVWNTLRVFVILGIVSAIAVFLPLGVGLWLAARLYTLAMGARAPSMDNSLCLLPILQSPLYIRPAPKYTDAYMFMFMHICMYIRIFIMYIYIYIIIYLYVYNS